MGLWRRRRGLVGKLWGMPDGMGSGGLVVEEGGKEREEEGGGGGKGG